MRKNNIGFVIAGATDTVAETHFGIGADDVDVHAGLIGADCGLEECHARDHSVNCAVILSEPRL